MIKLVVSDMDGTLLRDDKYMEPAIFRIILNMRRQGVTFVAASGRQYQGMHRFFAPVAEDIYFITDNGCRILFREEELFYHPMDQRVARQILFEILDEFPGCSVLVCCRGKAYSNTHRQERYLAAKGFRYNVEFREDLRTVEDNTILKISLIENESPLVTMDNLRRRYGHRAAVTFSGYNCIDFMSPGINKGVALTFLQERLGIGPDETMVFGDNFNDLEMMGRASVSYAMRHSPAGVRAAATHVLGSNNDDAAIWEMDRLFPQEK